MADQIPNFDSFVPKGASPARPSAIPTFADFKPKQPDAAPTTWLDDIGETVKQYWDKVNPIKQAQGVADLVTTDPRTTVRSYGATTAALAQKAEDAFKAGNYAEGVRHSISYVLNGIPGLGAALDEAGNKSGSGDYKGAIAATAALTTNLLAAKYGPKVLDAATEPGALPAAVAKVTTPVKNAAAAAHDLLNQPGTRDIISGVGSAASGVAGMTEGPIALMMGSEKLIKGIGDVSKGVAKRSAAKAAAIADADAATKAAADSAGAVAPNPLIPAGSGSTMNAAQYMAPAPLPAAAAPVNAAPQYFAPSSTGPLPAAPAPVTAPPINPYASTNSPAALAPAPLPAAAAPVNAAPQYFAPSSTGPLPAAPAPVTAPPINPYASTNSPAALATPAIAPAAEPIAVPVNPYFAGAGTAAPEAAPAPTPMPVPTNASPAPPAPPAAATPYEASAEALKQKYAANAANADEVKAQWMFDKGITSDQLKPGSEFKALVDQIPNPNAKSGKFTTRVNDPDHPLRVKAVADILDAKHANAASAKAAAALKAKGVTAATVSQTDMPGATPAQIQDLRFQLQKLETAPAAKP